MTEWDAHGGKSTLETLRGLLLERNYINNLLAAIDREAASAAGAAASGDIHG
jgi:hypothetical protein